MKVSGLVLFLLFVNNCFCFSQSSEGRSNLLEWNEYYELTWEDFKGKRADEAKGDAGTAVIIKAKPYYVKNKVRYDVIAYFDRNKSWATDKSLSLLAHEKLHFDIAELYARRIRKQIEELEKKNVNDIKTYNAAINLLLEESNEVDQKYDLETLHGALSKKQTLWEKKIKGELQLLKMFKKRKSVIKISGVLNQEGQVYEAKEKYG
ncbi:DUF922 domain-containing protein [Chryseosolibacter indicus]|uniref:DUF922 domain-containing protein n=1 Tax=Chryseosolibacter indicus TaxID=2782351 RepID=A0ABS5VKD6_9BACT|nr:DUF922 domain-containing protein [Chryseosolibacter indicus]MBT1701841.1 DUF922 domain-containing protein [Chryseosolibacter indicus]